MEFGSIFIGVIFLSFQLLKNKDNKRKKKKNQKVLKTHINQLFYEKLKKLTKNLSILLIF